jgi:hypothetical protein
MWVIKLSLPALLTDPSLPRHPPSNWLKLFLSQTLSHMDTPTILKFSHYLPTCLWRWNRQNVPKRRHIKFRRQGITQKKTYNIQNMAKVWNQELISCLRTAHKDTRFIPTFIFNKKASSCTDHSRNPPAMTFIWYSIRICGTNLHMHVALTNLLAECFELIHMRCQFICYCSIITYQSDVMTVQILDIFSLFLDVAGLLLQHPSFSHNLGNF